MTRVTVGDRVTLPSGEAGTVVGVIERQEYARNLEFWRWSSFADGIIVLLDSGTFTHVQEAEVGVPRRPEP